MLEGTNVIIRTVENDDYKKIYNLTKNIIKRGDHYIFSFYNENYLEKKMADDGGVADDFMYLVVTDKKDQLIGELAMFKPYPDNYEIGALVFEPEKRGKGIMTEAISIFSSYLFELKPIERLQACISIKNIPAKRLLEKCNFTYEGTLRRALFERGKYVDLEVYSQIREEAIPLKKVLSL